MSDIEICPFRIYTEVRPAILQGQGDVTVMGFMDCLKNKCPAFYVRDGEEHCKRLAEPERKTGRWILVKGSNGKDYHKCSCCLHTQEITGVKNYCSVCGADMMEAEHD